MSNLYYTTYIINKVYKEVYKLELVEYTVRSGNTLFGIAQFFQTTVEEILRYNNIQNPSQLYVGQVLSIPAGSAPNRYYSVRPGDTLWSIAQRTNTSVRQLTDLNGLRNPNIIYPGQILIVG